MVTSHVEYMGFQCQEASREYRLRVHHGATIVGDVTMAIPNSAFTAKIVRYQDGPDLCFHKLQEVVAALTADLPARIELTDADLADYCAARAPKASVRRAKVIRPAS